MSYRKKLIEVAFPTDDINRATEAEHNPFLKGHSRALHQWWSRKPLAPVRAVLLASILDDPSNDLPEELATVERDRLLKLVASTSKWDSLQDSQLYKMVRDEIESQHGQKSLFVYDPFSGGGSIPLEAQRLGLIPYAADLNPVAVIINKVLLEILPLIHGRLPVNPQQSTAKKTVKHYSGVIDDVEYYGAKLKKHVKERLEIIYQDEIQPPISAWLWCHSVQCSNPACKSEIPLTSSFQLSSEVFVTPNVVKDRRTVLFEVVRGKKPLLPTIEATGAKCLVCDQITQFDVIRTVAQGGGLRQQLMAVVRKGTKGTKTYHSPTKADIDQAQITLSTWEPIGELPPKALGFRVQKYGITQQKALFTPRQLAFLSTCTELIEDIHKWIMADMKEPDREYAKAIATLLALAISRLSDFMNVLCSWNIRNENVRNAFGLPTVSMTWNFAEANPFGTLLNIDTAVGWITNALTNLPISAIQGSVSLLDAASEFPNIPDNPIISMDPPYYGVMGYANLADYFYIWLRRSLKDFYPEIFSTLQAPKDAEIVAEPARFDNNNDLANEFFENQLSKTLKLARENMNSEFPTSIYYAYKQDEITSSGQISTGWERLLSAMIDSGMQITGTWPLRTERKERQRALGSNALASSIVLICRPRPDDAPTTSRRAFLDDLRRELPAALKAMQSGNIAPVDLAQASIGPGMAIYSRYSKVLEADGSPMSVRTALGLINAALDEYLAEQDGDIDPDTRFAVDWFTQFGFNEGEFGLADVLARAKNTSVSGVEAAGVVVSGRGKVKLKHWSEYDPGAWDPTQDKRPTVWEATHHLIERLNSHGETGSALLMQKMPSDMAAEARQLAYRLYSICERKNWADHARDYNALVISWSGIGEEAARLRDAVARGDATNQMSMFDDEA